MKEKQNELNMHIDEQKPTLQRIRVHGIRIGLPESECNKFHAFYESNGWKVGKNKMVSWTSAMAHWKMVWEDRKQSSKKSVYELTKIMEANTRMADEIKRKHCSEVAGGPKWDSQEYRKQHLEILRHINDLNREIASMR